MVTSLYTNFSFLMLSNFKSNILGYFKFIYNIAGKKFIFSSFLTIVVSVLDGIGLAMFIPLLQSVDQDGTAPASSLGFLHYITDFIELLGFNLTIETILITLVILFVVKGIIKFIELNYQAGLIHFF